MSVASFTNSAIAAFHCPTDKDRAILWDAKTPGFGVAAFRSGSKVFVAQFRESGRSRRTTIGDWPETSLAEARAAARKLLSTVRLKSQNDRRAERERTRIERPVAGFERYVSVRLPVKMVEAIDNWAAEHAHAAPGGLRRSNAVRMLLGNALRLHKGASLPGGTRVHVVMTDDRDVERRPAPDPKRDAKRLADKYVARNGKPR